MKRKVIFRAIAIVALLAGTAGADEGIVHALSVEEAVTRALGDNPALKEAEARIRAAEAAVRSSRADLLPEASLNYSYHHLEEPPIMKLSGSELQTAHQDLYNWDVTVLQPLFTGFALSSKLNMAKLDIAARRLEKEQTALDLTRQVKSTCYQLLLAQQLEAVSNQEVEALTAHQRDAELFFGQGLIQPNGLLQARVALANSVQLQEKARADVQKARVHLNRLMNRPLEDAVLIRMDVSVPEPAPQPDSEALGILALKQRPLMQLLDISLQQLQDALRIANSAWYPTVSLFGRYEQSGDDPGATHNDYSNSYTTAIGVQAQWKFFQSGKTRAEAEGAKRRIDALQAGIAQYRNQVREEVVHAALDCRTSRNNIETARAALAQASENWRITDLQYKQQMATATDVLDARAFLTQADSNYYRSLYGYLDAVAGLDRAIGKRLAGDQ